jgi:hypothetical protein
MRRETPPWPRSKGIPGASAGAVVAKISRSRRSSCQLSTGFGWRWSSIDGRSVLRELQRRGAREGHSRRRVREDEGAEPGLRAGTGARLGGHGLADAPRGPIRQVMRLLWGRQAFGRRLAQDRRVSDRRRRAGRRGNPRAVPRHDCGRNCGGYRRVGNSAGSLLVAVAWGLRNLARTNSATGPRVRMICVSVGT